VVKVVFYHYEDLRFDPPLNAYREVLFLIKMMIFLIISRLYRRNKVFDAFGSGVSIIED
jgi:hypothetical protein